MNESAPGKSISGLPTELQEKLADALDGYLQGLEQGVPPDVGQLTQGCPELEGPLREYLEGLQLLEGEASAFRQGRTRPTPSTPLVTKQLGDFELIREIGRGGMGIVYEARQLSLDRKVALKVLPFAAMLDPKQIARFQNEARAAAQLHHPHIVPIYFVGTERGVHFYAMQFVEGLTLRQILDDLQAESPRETTVTWGMTQGGEAEPTRSEVTASGAAHATGMVTGSHVHVPSQTQPTNVRLRRTAHIQQVARIGQQAAEALQAAHDCGIIHRDIKPSNLMVDGQGKLWVTDFGLARIQSGEHHTQTGDIVGTVHYMSPEQAHGNSIAIDARTDVYALGVTLYELLAGRRPFDGANYTDTLRQIDQGHCRSVSSWNRAVPSDLANVVAKAMAPQREDRYETAQALADDLQRFLQGHPTQARKPSAARRFSRWTQRNQLVVAATLLVLVLGLAGLGVTSLLLQRKADLLQQALHTSQTNMRRAQSTERLARDAIDTLGPRTVRQLAQTPGTQEVRSLLLSRSLEYHRELLEISHTQSMDDLEIAKLRLQIGQLQTQMGAYHEALTEYEQAGQLLAPAGPGQQLDPAERSTWLLCQTEKAMTLFRMAQHAQALEIYAQVDRQLETSGWADSPELASQRALCANNEGLIHADRGEIEAARASYEKAIRMAEPLITPSATNAATNPTAELWQGLAASWNNLAQLATTEQLELAINQTRKALEYQRRAVQLRSSDEEALSDLATYHTNLAALLSRARRYEESLEAYAPAQEIQTRLAEKEPLLWKRRHDLAITLNNCGRTLGLLKRDDEATKYLLQARDMDEQLLKTHPGDVEVAGHCGGIYNNLAMVRQRRGQLHLALEDYVTATRLLDHARQNAPEGSRYRQYLNTTLVNYARLLIDMGQLEQGLEVTLRLRTLCERDPDQLAAIATDLAKALPQAPPQSLLQGKLRSETRTTIEMAKKAGWKPPRDYQDSIVYKVTQEDAGF